MNKYQFLVILDVQNLFYCLWDRSTQSFGKNEKNTKAQCCRDGEDQEGEIIVRIPLRHKQTIPVKKLEFQFD